LNVSGKGEGLMMREQWQQVVRLDGTLDPDRTTDRIVLYTGRNGKRVERFRLSEHPDAGTFIFKPLTNPDTLGREPWLYQRLLPLIPVRVPRLLATAEHSNPETYWSIFEDVGPLAHRNDECAVMKAAEAMAHWHRLPLNMVPSHFRGDKPGYEEAWETVTRERNAILSLYQAWGAPDFSVRKWLQTVEQSPELSISETVICHGDFHCGNFSLAGQELTVLDWEHAHRNSVFWDLYHLLDMTHPLYRKQNNSIRMKALQAYGSARGSFGWTGYTPRFIREYHLFASVYSAWMILLIGSDMEKSTWNTEGLTEQMKETCRALAECGSYLLS
jgi:hypothetical protein